MANFDITWLELVALCANYRRIPIIGNTRINYQHRAFICVVGVARLKIISRGRSRLAFKLHTELSKVDFVVSVTY